MSRTLRWIALLMVAALCVSAAAGAETGGMSFAEWKDQLLGVRSFTFQRHRDGIGLGDCPVYTAPSKDSLRFANNRQAVDTEKDLYEAGKTEEGWLLVRYEPVSGTTRVGYIPPQNLKDFKSGMSARNFGNVSAVAAEAIDVTDNPIQKDGKVFTTLQAGDSFRVLAKYTYHGNWWYIECTAEGKTARGFIDREKSSFYPGEDVQDHMNQTPVSLETLGTPGISPMNTRQAGTILIKGSKVDERKLVHREPGMDSKQVSVVYPTNTYPCYGVKDTAGGTWYYVFVEEDTVWGWVSGAVATFSE